MFFFSHAPFSWYSFQSYSISQFLRVKQSESGCSLISLEGHLRVETENKDHSQITMDVAGMNLESK